MEGPFSTSSFAAGTGKRLAGRAKSRLALTVGAEGSGEMDICEDELFLRFRLFTEVSDMFIAEVRCRLRRYV